MSRIALDLRLWAGSSPPRPRWQARGIVASRLSAPYEAANISPNPGNHKEVYEQTRFRFADDCSALSILYDHVSNQQSSGIGIGSFTVKAALFRGTEWGSFDQYSVLTWAGGSDGLMRSSAINPGDILESDVSAFGGSSGGTFLCRRHVIFSAAPSYWPGSQINYFDGDEPCNIGDNLPERISPGTTYPSNDWAGAYYASDRAVNYCYSAPTLVLGVGAARKARICIVNDSIGFGSGDDGGVEFAGWPARLLTSSYAWYLVGNSGYALGDLMSDSTKRALRLGALAQAGITHLIVQAGTDDLGQGRTTAEFMADASALQTELASRNIRVILCTSSPRTNAGNATKADGDSSSIWGERLTLNQAIRDGNGIGHGYLDVAAATQAAANANLWDNTSGRGSADGIHPNAATHAYIAAQLTGQLSPLLSVAHFA